jgi:hypothetical protein
MNKKYNKIIMLAMALMLALAGLLSGCNRQVVDLTYSYERAIICLPNGEIVEGKVQSWKDYDNSDQIQVKINGTTYLVHSSNIVLIAE